MRIGFDAKRAFHNTTGLGNYSRTLINNFRHFYPEDNYIYFTPDTGSSYSRHFPSESIVTPQGFQPLWRSFSIKKDIRKSKVDLFHGLSNELPFGIDKSGIPSVVTIHDVIFDIVKEDFPWYDRLVYRIKTEKCIEEATKIIAISHATKQDLIHRFDVDADKIEVIYQPIDARFNQETISTRIIKKIKENYQLPDEYLLYVGALMKRKNLLPMLRAWEQLPASHQIPLLIFGQGGEYKAKLAGYINDHGLGTRVQMRPPALFRDLPVLYRLAETVIYPSLYEGFGLPVLEALACGTKVVTSAVSSMPEAGGALPVYVNPDKVESISAGIIDSLEQSPPSPVEVSRHLAQFDRGRLTEQIMDLYRKIAKN